MFQEGGAPSRTELAISFGDSPQACVWCASKNPIARLGGESEKVIEALHPNARCADGPSPNGRFMHVRAPEGPRRSARAPRHQNQDAKPALHVR